MYNELDTEKAGKVSQANFTTRIVSLVHADEPVRRHRAGRDNGRGSWQDWDNMIGGWFKFHWLDPQKITVKMTTSRARLTKMFERPGFDVNDEIYTFSVTLVLAQERARPDERQLRQDELHGQAQGEQSASRPRLRTQLDPEDGQGRVFYMALGHNERIYAMTPMLEHLLAGMQYALGDLKADDARARSSARSHRAT